MYYLGLIIGGVSDTKKYHRARLRNAQGTQVREKVNLLEFGLSKEQNLLQDQTARFLKEKIPLDAVRAM